MGRRTVEFDTQDPKTGKKYTIVKITITQGVGGIGSDIHEEEVEIKVDYLTKRNQIRVDRIDDDTYEIRCDLKGSKNSIIVKKI